MNILLIMSFIIAFAVFNDDDDDDDVAGKIEIAIDIFIIIGALCGWQLTFTYAKLRENAIKATQLTLAILWPYFSHSTTSLNLHK